MMRRIFVIANTNNILTATAQLFVKQGWDGRFTNVVYQIDIIFLSEAALFASFGSSDASFFSEATVWI